LRFHMSKHHDFSVKQDEHAKAIDQNGFKLDQKKTPKDTENKG